MMILLGSLVAAESLSNYPHVFTQRPNDVPFIVVGKYAPPQDVVTGTEVGVALQQILLRTSGAQIPLAKLDQEFMNSYVNAVVIGSAMDNKIIGRVVGSSSDNPFGLNPGEALIKLVRDGSEHYLLITGYSSREVVKAGDLIAQYERYKDFFGDNEEILIRDGYIVTSFIPSGFNPGWLRVPDFIRRVPSDPNDVNVPSDDPVDAGDITIGPYPGDPYPSASQLPGRRPGRPYSWDLPARGLDPSANSYPGRGSLLIYENDLPSRAQPIVVRRNHPGSIVSNGELVVSYEHRNLPQRNLVAGSHFYDTARRTWIVG